eukprot:maker-scaffold351_size199180-snap-gene-0.29 protein:Tk02213 transcript:maker-scaffold351_size199180-snap-gene-0.29-mRNA-1 annotation:"hypothetical protein L798_09428"
MELEAVRTWSELLQPRLSVLQSRGAQTEAAMHILAPPAIQLRAVPTEPRTLSQITRSDGSKASQTVLTLAVLLDEIEFCLREAPDRLFRPLLYYGLVVTEPSEAGALVALSRFLPTLQAVVSFHEHGCQVLVNLLQQLSVVCPPPADVVGRLRPTPVHFPVLFDQLGRLLVCLITLDSILQDQTRLRRDWLAYRKLVTAQLVPDPTGPDQWHQLDQMLQSLDEALFGAGLGNVWLQDELVASLKSSLNDLERNLGCWETDHTQRLVALAARFGLANAIFQVTEKRISAQMLEHFRKVPSIVLWDNVLWFPEQFFLACLPKFAKAHEKKLQQLSSQRQTIVKSLGPTLSQEFNSWISRMETRLKGFAGTPSLDELERKTQLLVQGLNLASGIREKVVLGLNLHSKFGLPLTKSGAIAVGTLTEMLKAIEHSYQRYDLSVLDVVAHASQHRSVIILTSIHRAKKAIMALADVETNSSMRLVRSDQLSSLALAELTIAGSPSPERLIVTRLALALAAQHGLFKEEEVRRISHCLRELATLSTIQSRIQNTCGTDFFYWHRTVLHVYLSHIYENRMECAKKLVYVFWVINDSADALVHNDHCERKRDLRDHFEQEMTSVFHETILDPLCRDLETDLRLQVHSHLKLDSQNPFQHVTSKDLSPLLNLPPLLLADKFIDVKAHVEEYLANIFYNLTTVALHNWSTYGQMRALAAHNYGIITTDDHLPAQTLEQGVDILEIMRNIHIFVSRYLYNLNNQIFVEESSENKHVNTINIRHIANSIRTHGMGIINTTVNFTYQFLRKKFVIFSQFLYDEHIKSRLNVEIRYFKECEGSYPFERANKFNKAIRKLGYMPDGITTYLDQFRMLLSHIGNALGYVRMIRSGGSHFISNAIRFVPDLENIPKFQLLTEEAAKRSRTSESIEASRGLDQVLDNLSQNFTDGVHYFKLLVDVFSRKLGEKKHNHLKAFYIIVPSLTLNYVEHMIVAKDKLSKRNIEGAAFTDDGFGIGIAYVLQVLEQWSQFDSLHWFQSIQDKHGQERAQAEEQIASQNDEKLKQTLSLTLRRLDSYQRASDNA